MYTKSTWSILNLYIFFDIKEKSCDWVIKLGDKYQNFLIFIALHMTGNEDRTVNLIKLSPNLSRAIKLGDKAQCHGGNQTLGGGTLKILFYVISDWKSIVSFHLSFGLKSDLYSKKKIIGKTGF